jgi:hypothetical protein
LTAELQQLQETALQHCSWHRQAAVTSCSSCRCLLLAPQLLHQQHLLQGNILQDACVMLQHSLQDSLAGSLQEHLSCR